MNTIVVIENKKLIHKQVTNEEYAKINAARDPDGMYWFHQICRLP